MQERMVKGQIQRVFTGKLTYLLLIVREFYNLLICYVGADAIEWFMDNMVGISTVEQAQVSTHIYRPEILHLPTSLNVHTACR